MRSASSITPLLATLGGALLVLALSGCDTTQEKAARLKVSSERTIAGREPVEVRRRADAVEVEDAVLLGGGGRTAVVVTLRNTGEKPVNDLPIAVGVRAEDGSRAYLNVRQGLDYFDSHLASLDAGERDTWVFTGKDDEVPEGAAFAEVGGAASPPLTVAASLPAVELGEVRAADGDPAKARLEVANHSPFPQYDLPVMVWAAKDGRYLAAGRTSAGDLEPGETEALTVRLVGEPKAGDLHASAPPTIFQ